MRGRYRGQIDARRYHGGSLRSRGRQNRCSNPQLMIVNPHMTKGDAEEAFRTFHHVKATTSKKVNLPSGFPKYLTQLGKLDTLTLYNLRYDTEMKVVPPKRPKTYVATDPSMNRVYIGPVGKNVVEAINEFPYVSHIAYTTPVKSKGVGRRWYHDFDRPAYIEVEGPPKNMWLILSSQTLEVTDRGIEG